VPLSALRVIELGSLPAAAYCARLLADFGAEVIKVEPAGGDPMRLAAPMIGGVLTSAVLNLLIYPVLYVMWRKRQMRGCNPEH